MSFSRWSSMSPNPAPPLYTMQHRWLLDRPLFAFSLPRSAYFGEPPREGKLTLGAIDYSAYTEALRYNPITSSARYQDLWVVRGTYSLDTGSSFIVLPMQMARDLFSRLRLQMEASGNSLIAMYWCRSYPSITIRTRRSRIVLHPSSMQFGAKEDGWCTLSVIGANQEDVTLGRPFFESAYTIISLSGRVGLCRIRGDEDRR
ncbi:hypothetical protein V8E36_007537 [Tilletia maclaganii]